MELISSDYYAETSDEKTSGSIVLRKDALIGAYSLPGYRNRSIVLTNDGMKFCLKGKPGQFLNNMSLLQEGEA